MLFLYASLLEKDYTICYKNYLSKIIGKLRYTSKSSSSYFLKGIFLRLVPTYILNYGPHLVTCIAQIKFVPRYESSYNWSSP